MMFYVWSWKSYVYTIQYCNNKMELPRQEFRINYHKLNQYLTNKSLTNTQFYQYFHQSQINHLQYLHFSHTQSNLKDIEGESSPLSQMFVQSERQIFGEIINRKKEIDELQHQLSDSQRQIIYLRARIAQMIDSKTINSQQECLIEQQKINKIKRQRQQLQRKIQVAKLLSLSNLDEQIRQAKLKTQQIKASIAKLNQKLKKQGKFGNKEQLINEIGQIQYGIGALKDHKKQQLIHFLNQRKILQQEMIKEDEQKQQFFGLLLNFKKKFQNAKDKNRRLKQQLAKEGLSLPVQKNQ